MDTPEQAARRFFGKHAAHYVASASHTDEAVLARVVELACTTPSDHVLDIATGAGHAALALAPHVAGVVATDLTPEMLREAKALRARRGVANTTFAQCDAHALPFPNATFDVVVSRRAPHHFSAIDGALSEMRRVLRPEGRLIIDDRSVPEDDFVDACMNELDRWHDPSHVREHRPSEWRRMLAAAGFRVETVECYTRHRPLASLTNSATPEDAERIHRTVASLTKDECELLNVREVDGELHINHWFVMIAAVPDGAC